MMVLLMKEIVGRLQSVLSDWTLGTYGISLHTWHTFLMVHGQGDKGIELPASSFYSTHYHGLEVKGFLRRAKAQKKAHVRVICALTEERLLEVSRALMQKEAEILASWGVDKARHDQMLETFAGLVMEIRGMEVSR